MFFRVGAGHAAHPVVGVDPLRLGRGALTRPRLGLEVVVTHVLAGVPGVCCCCWPIDSFVPHNIVVEKAEAASIVYLRRALALGGGVVLRVVLLVQKMFSRRVDP